MLSTQGILDLPQDDAESEGGYQFEGADLDTKPGKRCYWIESIAIDGDEWLERHGSTM